MTMYLSTSTAVTFNFFRLSSVQGAELDLLELYAHGTNGSPQVFVSLDSKYLVHLVY